MMCKLSVSVVAFILIASLGRLRSPNSVTASLYESRIIGISFPAEQSQARNSIQKFQQRGQHPNQASDGGEISLSQPRLDSVKRTILLKGLRSGQVSLQRIAPFGNPLASQWDNGKSTRVPNQRAAWRYRELLDSGLQRTSKDDSLSSSQSVFGLLGRSKANLSGGEQRQIQTQAVRQRHRSGTEEVALHTPMNSHSSNDYEWKRVENTRWNNLRGMWGKRAASAGEPEPVVEDKFKRLVELLEKRGGPLEAPGSAELPAVVPLSSSVDPIVDTLKEHGDDDQATM